VFGARVAGRPGYAFLPAVEQSGPTWTKADLPLYRKDPLGKVPDARTTVAPPAPARRQAVIENLEAL